MREFFTRLFDWFRRDRLEAELRDELDFHRASLERDARPAHDPVSARRRMGNITQVVEDSRDRWSVPWLDHVQQDIRYAVRGLRRSPGFTFGVVATLALGIGANAGMFGVVDRLMFRPYPMLKDPSTAHRIYLRYTERNGIRTNISTEYTRYLDLQRWSTSFTQFAAFFPTMLSVGSGDATRELPIAAVSASYFDFFDATPAIGRFFMPDEDVTPIGAPVAVLSFGFWQAQFAGQDVVGRTLQIGDRAFTIIGVAPKGFSGVTESSPRAAFIPITTYAGSQPGSDGREYYTSYAWGWTEMMARRKPDVSVEQASRDLTKAYVRSWNTERGAYPQLPPADVARPHAVAGALKTSAGPDPALEARTALWISGVALIVLLIACANVANLFLGRALRRRREVALRLALGVNRKRLAAQVMTESLVLSFVGCAAGLVVAHVSGRVIGTMFLPEWEQFSLFGDSRTLLVAVAASLLAAITTGMVPALLATRADLAVALKTGAREGMYQRSRMRSALLVVQGALSVLLLVGAGLFVRSLDHARDMRLGYDVDRLLLVGHELRGTVLSDTARLALRRQMLDEALRLPGVERASLVASVPFYATYGTQLFVSGIDSVQRLGQFTYQVASTDYFPTMGTRILQGRAFGPDDRAGATPVAVVSQGMAKVLWPGQDALGMCFRVGSDTMPCTTIVGIAEDAVQSSLSNPQRFRYYLPLEQYRPMIAEYLVLRVRGEPARMQDDVRKRLQQLMPGQAFVSTLPLIDLIDARRQSWEMGAKLFAALGGLALVVAAIGLYAVIGYNVAQRMHELGVRIALGAQSRDVVRLVVGQGIVFALAGVAIGGALALAAGRWVQPLLFQQSARDPLVYASVAVLLTLVAILASSIPAVHATRADPNRTLRAE